MPAFRLEKELEDRVAKVAAAKGSNKSAIVRDAVIRYLDTLLAQRARDERKDHVISVSLWPVRCLVFGDIELAIFAYPAKSTRACSRCLSCP